MRAFVLLALGLAAVFGAAARAQQPEPVGVLLQRSAGYLDAYEKNLATVVAEEDYKASGAAGSWKVVNFDANILLVGANGSWLEFRDVYAVSGRQVRNHQDRFEALLGNPNDVLAKAQQIADESARYNIGPRRNFNIPTMALTYLMRANQPRSAFRIVSAARSAAVIAFQETARPPLIHAPVGTTETSGRFWINAETGAVTKSELTVRIPESAEVKRDAAVSGTITVTYGQDDDLKFLVPHEMDESYDQPSHISGRATYSHYKAFGVVVTSSTGRGGR